VAFLLAGASVFWAKTGAVTGAGVTTDGADDVADAAVAADDVADDDVADDDVADDDVADDEISDDSTAVADALVF